MEIEKNVSGDNLEIILPGRIDGTVANELEVEIIDAVNKDFKSIYVNLAQATFLCSAAIRVMLQYHRKMSGQGRKLQVSNPAPEVAAALELTGFTEIVEK